MSPPGARWLPFFFALAACSWMPHWSCHYYRLETASSFVVGAWKFTPRDSVLAMCVYSALIVLNLTAVVFAPARFAAAFFSGLGHVTIAGIHIARLAQPFRFEVFNHLWPLGASAREVALALGFGVLCFGVAWRTLRRAA